MSDNNNCIDYSIYRPPGYPVRHKQKIPFDPRLKLSVNYHAMVREIFCLDSKLDDVILSDKDYAEFVNDAYSTNIHWSVKIEGNDLPLEEVKRITKLFTSGQKEEEKRNGFVQEILNHLYSFFMENDFKQPWDLYTIREVHRILMKGVDPNVIPGQFRTEEVYVAREDGFEYFKGCPKIDIEKETRSLLSWLEYSPFDAVCTSALFFHEFESIHPFGDGNGRTGRTLFQILLQELGLKNSKLCKFEQELLKDNETYYTLLAYTDYYGDYVPFIMYVTEALLRSYNSAVELFENNDMLKDLDEASKTIAKRSKSAGSFTVSDASKWIPTLQEQAIRSKLNSLVSQGILESTGNTRSKRYQFKDPFKEIRERI